MGTETKDITIAVSYYTNVKAKVKVSPITGYEGPEGEYRYSSISLTSVLGGGGWSTPRPSRFAPGNKAPYPLYRRLDEPQGRSGRVQKISSATEIRTPNRPSRSELLYRLGYSGPHYTDILR
jgi:hypothetical protein